LNHICVEQLGISELAIEQLGDFSEIESRNADTRPGDLDQVSVYVREREIVNHVWNSLQANENELYDLRYVLYVARLALDGCFVPAEIMLLRIIELKHRFARQVVGEELWSLPA
jgi:hypothetical protein